MTEIYERAWTHEGRPDLVRRGLGPAQGPWLNEPDKIHWIDSETDLDCLMVRNPMGAWCGYVGVPPEHPFHGVGYDGCVKNAEECADEGYCDHTPNAAVEVHGGLTFANSCYESEKGEGFGICHVPLAGRPADVWWFGFDTVHLGDLSPFDAAELEAAELVLDGEQAARHARISEYRGGDVYRDVDYVKAETANLAKQLAAVA